MKVYIIQSVCDISRDIEREWRQNCNINQQWLNAHLTWTFSTNELSLFNWNILLSRSRRCCQKNWHLFWVIIIHVEASGGEPYVDYGGEGWLVLVLECNKQLATSASWPCDPQRQRFVNKQGSVFARRWWWRCVYVFILGQAESGIQHNIQSSPITQPKGRPKLG